MKITKELLKEWDACSNGFKWFLQKFPQGGDVHEVGSTLRVDKRYDDARWLTSHVFEQFIKTPSDIASYVEGDVAAVIKETDIAVTLKAVEGSPIFASGYYSKAASSGNSSTAASSGYYSTAASSGYSSKAASSGNSSKAASSGDYSTAASSGDYSTAASSGNSSTAASSGDYSKAASSGNSSKAEAIGEKTVSMVAGCNGRAKAGLKGAFALAWHDENSGSMKICVGEVGFNGIKADVFYCVKNGVLVEF